MTAEVLRFSSQDELSAEFASRFASLARSEGLQSFVLTGGSSASLVYPRLARAAIDWRPVEIFFGDERAVPPDHADSNFALAQKTLLSALESTAAIHRIRGESNDLDEAAREYETMIATHPRLGLVHLGMGEDGHVCSLFPDHAGLRERSRLVIPIFDSPKPPPRRITLTLAALSRARRIWITATGAGKADAIARALYDESSELPLALATRLPGVEVTWFLDEAASSKVAR